jgi:sarcosine oxidase/L-pipecolate oxidase
VPFIIDAFLLAHRSRCGVLVLGSADEQLYASKAYTNDVALGVRTVKYDSGSGAVRVPRTAFPEGVKTGPAFEDTPAAPVAYLNLDSGWAASARGVEILMARVIALGGKVIGGKAVTGLVRESDGRTTGVRLADGSSVRASLVVIASGSWTASTFRELALGERCISTG